MIQGHLFIAMGNFLKLIKKYVLICFDLAANNSLLSRTKQFVTTETVARLDIDVDKIYRGLTNASLRNAFAVDCVKFDS